MSYPLTTADISATQYYSTRELAYATRIPRRQIQLSLFRKELKGKKIGKNWIVLGSEFHKWIERF